MLQVTVPEQELFDESTSTFTHIKEAKLNLEHSLISLSKWESKWHKPFLTDEDKTNEEIIDYIRCMTMNTAVNPNTYKGITSKIISQVNEYIQDPMTATWFSDDKNPHNKSRKIITSEVIYGWMVGFQIPFECEKWHINRLITLIRVCEINNSPNKKMPMRQNIEDRRSLNEKRKQEMHTKG